MKRSTGEVATPDVATQTSPPHDRVVADALARIEAAVFKVTKAIEAFPALLASTHPQHAMPDGKPCPDLLTPAEAIKYLRLDQVKGVKDPLLTLRHYRQIGSLKGLHMGRAVVYRLEELQRFAKKKQDDDA